MTPSPISIDQRRAQSAKFGAIIMKKYGLTGPQIGILRDAARKYTNWATKTELHDGQVATYGVRQDSLDALTAKGYIATVYRYSEEERQTRWKQAEEIKNEMFQLAGQHQPNDRIPADPDEPNSGTLEVWKLVMKELQQAAALLKGNEEKVLRITDAGRVVAAEFKEAIGAEEE